MATSHDYNPGSRAIGPVLIRVSTREQAVAEIIDAVRLGSLRIFGFCNAHTVNLARSSAQLRDALDAMTIFNDGVGVDIASRVLHSKRFPENLNGTDLTPAVLSRLPSGTRVFLLGSTPAVLTRALSALSLSFPHIAFCGSMHGFFQKEEGKLVAERISKSGAKLVLVGMGQPRQELWAVANCELTGANLLCVGAYLDFAAGRFPRAPSVTRKLRLEWLFRLSLEPRRLWRRYLLGNISFLLHIMRLRLNMTRP